MEMKAEIIQRLQGPKAGQMENTNNFHNLYVKRHTNVRYALGVSVPAWEHFPRESRHTVTTYPLMGERGPLLFPF